MKSIHGQRYKIIQLRLTILLVFWTALLRIQLCSGLAGLANSKNAVLYAVHAMQLYRVQGLTPPIHACAVRVMNFGAETKFEKGASDRNSHPIVECNVAAFSELSFAAHWQGRLSIG